MYSTKLHIVNSNKYEDEGFVKEKHQSIMNRKNQKVKQKPRWKSDSVVWNQSQLFSLVILIYIYWLKGTLYFYETNLEIFCHCCFQEHSLPFWKTSRQWLSQTFPDSFIRDRVGSSLVWSLGRRKSSAELGYSLFQLNIKLCDFIFLAIIICFHTILKNTKLLRFHVFW